MPFLRQKASHWPMRDTMFPSFRTAVLPHCHHHYIPHRTLYCSWQKTGKLLNSDIKNKSLHNISMVQSILETGENSSFCYKWHWSKTTSCKIKSKPRKLSLEMLSQAFNLLLQVLSVSSYTKSHRIYFSHPRLSYYCRIYPTLSKNGKIYVKYLVHYVYLRVILNVNVYCVPIR